MVVAEENMLDAGLDVAPDDVEQRRRRRRQTDLGLRCVQQSLRGVRPAADEDHLLGGAVDVDEHGRSIDQIAARPSGTTTSCA